ncbi:MAG: ABC transporter ATP-binding protein, partial [Flexibacteraceae bacterium]
LSVTEGEIVFLLGRNGSGKTTFIKSLCSEIAYQGKIEIAGTDIKQLKPKVRAGLIANLPQLTQTNFDISVLELVIAGKFHQKKLLEDYSKTDEAEAIAAIESLGFAQPQQSILTLSGGEQQMIWLAQVSMQNTPLIVLDEPTQHLDLYYKKQVFNQLETWVNEGKTILVSTHDIQYLAQFPKARLLFFQKYKTPVLYSNTPENLDFIIKSIEQGS